MRRILAAAVMAAMAWPASAAATDYGGGNAPAGVRKAHKRIVLVGIRTFLDGTARVRVLVHAGCGSGTAARRVGIAPDGSFAFDATVRNRPRENPRVRRTARVSMSGRLVGATGSGSASVRLVFRRAGRVRARCRSGPRAWQVRAAPPEPVAAAARPNGAYFGLTSQGANRVHPFVLRVARRGGRVMTAMFDYRQRCRFGPREWNNITPGGRIRPDGTFRLRERFVYRWANANERFRVRVNGRFTPNGVSGTFSVKGTARAPGSGRVIGRCRTGGQTFAAAL